MTFIFTGVFWAAVLILLGILVILNAILGTHIPFVRIFFALLLCYIGLSILFGPAHRYHHRFSTEEPERIIVTGEAGKQDVVFSNSEIDLTGLELKDRTMREEVHVAFGSARVKLNPNLPVRIEASSAFGEAKLPDGASIGFGDHTYRSKGLDENRPYLLLKADVAFGRLDIVTAAASGEPSKDTTSTEKGAS